LQRDKFAITENFSTSSPCPSHTHTQPQIHMHTVECTSDNEVPLTINFRLTRHPCIFDGRFVSKD